MCSATSLPAAAPMMPPATAPTTAPTGPAAAPAAPAASAAPAAPSAPPATPPPTAVPTPTPTGWAPFSPLIGSRFSLSGVVFFGMLFSSLRMVMTASQKRQSLLNPLLHKEQIGCHPE